LEMLREGPLVKFVVGDDDDAAVGDDDDADAGVKKEDDGVKSEEEPAVSAAAAEHANGEANGENTDAVKSEEEPVATAAAAAEHANGATVEASIVASSSSDPPTAAIVDEHLKSQLVALEQYIASLHMTELSLRKGLMKAIDKKQSGGSGGGETLLQISTLAIATAADEVEGAADAEDWRFFISKNKENGNAANEEDDDSHDGNNGSDIKWSNKVNDHMLLGQVIYRPQSSPLRPAQEGNNTAGDGHHLNEKCHWYRIVSYTPSVKAVEVVTSEGGNKPTSQTNPLSESTGEKDVTRPNTIVERRMRFRAVPMAESDIDVPPSEIEEMDIDDEDIEYMVLTEAQSRSGVEAAVLHRKIENKQKKALLKEKSVGSAAADGTADAAVSQSQGAHNAVHPYRNGHGSRVMLTPQPTENGEEEDNDGQQSEVLYGVIAGYTTTMTTDSTEHNKVVKHRLLVLLEEDQENKNAKEEDEDDDDDSDKKSKSCAFWSTVDPEGTFLTEIALDNHSSSIKEEDVAPTTAALRLYSRYSIEMHEFFQGSPAYNVCESIVSYLKNHSKSGPFMHPVDPIALGIPEYASMIKDPMDISTLAKNLGDGKYSRIPPSDNNAEDDEDDGTDTPVYRMAYGPFYDAIMLIFDNCIRFNGDTSWIGGEAAILKKNVMKKMEQVVNKAVWSGQGTSAKSSSGGGGGGASSRRAKKKSMYTEEDSDADMYEYESDYEDDAGGGGKRRSRNARGNKPKSRKGRSNKEDIPSKAIEQPFMLPENAHDFGTGGAFPHLKIQSNVGKFSLSQDWSCRYIQEDVNEGSGGGDGKEEEGAGKKEDSTTEDEMLMLLQMQQEEDSGTIRRSTRARHAPKNFADEEVSANPTTMSYAPQAPITLPGVEYYLVNGDALQPKKMKAPEEDGEEGGNNNHSKDDTAGSLIPTICRSRLGAEGVQETIHERFYAELYRDHSPDALILDSGIGKYADGSFPPYLGRVVPSTTSTTASALGSNGEAMVWEIREQYLVPALRWVLRGLVRSGHLEEVDGSLSEGVLDDAPARTSFGAGIVVPSHEYYYNETFPPFDVLDEKEILRKRRQDAAAPEDSSSEEEVELSAYEQMRATRVARNAERLKALGLA